MYKSTRSTMLATTAAMLFGSAMFSVNIVHAEEATVQCGGVTGCKGQSDCKTATTACKGQNNCMGQGFKSLTKTECERRRGKIIER